MSARNNKTQQPFVNGDLLDLFDDQFSVSGFESAIERRIDETEGVVAKIQKVALNRNEPDDVKFIVNLSDEQKQAYKDGTLKFDMSKDGEMYAQLRKDGKYGEKLSISEDLEKEGIAEADARFAAELTAIKEQMAKMVEALKDIEGYVVDTLQGLHNDRVGLFYSGLSTFVEASQMPDSTLKDILISQSIKSLNDAQSQVMQEFKYDLAFLINREYMNEKNKRQKRLQERMENVHKCFDTIYRAMVLKAIIYFDIKQLRSMLMVFEEYSRFIEIMIKPNADLLIECDPQQDQLINTIWQRRAKSFIECGSMKERLLLNNSFYISREE